MPRLSSDTVERILLSFFFQTPYHIRLTKLGSDIFARSTHKKLAELIGLYIGKYKQPPTAESLTLFCDGLIKEGTNIEEYADALLLMEELPTAKPQTFDFYLEKAANYQKGRNIFDLSEFVKEQFERGEEIDFYGLERQMLNRLLAGSMNMGDTRRGFIYESVEERWRQYRKRTVPGDDDNVVPFGIKALDDALGGMHKSFVSLIYSRTSGGKSRLGMNIAINNAIARRNVVVFSLEMALELWAACIDSRLGWIDSNDIIFGRLNKDDKKKFRKALIEQAKEKLGIWIVDIPMGAKSIDILDELELYKASTGLEPELVVVDYLNLMEPMVRYNGRSEKYDFLGKEMHEIARIQNVALLTMTMESRTATQAQKNKKKDDDIDGVENIGLSNYLAPHCEVVMRLIQSAHDRLQNRLWAAIDKHRYGSAFEKILLTAIWEHNYVGDRLVPGTKGVRVRKRND